MVSEQFARTTEKIKRLGAVVVKLVQGAKGRGRWWSSEEGRQKVRSLTGVVGSNRAVWKESANRRPA
jgi:hypothetical protein